jgi:hypothetical protein
MYVIIVMGKKQYAYCATEQAMVNAPDAKTAYNDVVHLQSKDPVIIAWLKTKRFVILV